MGKGALEAGSMKPTSSEMQEGMDKAGLLLNSFFPGSPLPHPS